MDGLKLRVAFSPRRIAGNGDEYCKCDRVASSFNVFIRFAVGFTCINSRTIGNTLCVAEYIYIHV